MTGSAQILGQRARVRLRRVYVQGVWGRAGRLADTRLVSFTHAAPHGTQPRAESAENSNDQANMLTRLNPFPIKPDILHYV